MNLKALLGAGDRIMLATLPFAIAGILLNVIFPAAFRLHLGVAGAVLGWALLVIGVPIWLMSAVQILTHVPRHELITSGPFALVLHPIYTSVALLVIPGIGLLLDTWMGLAIGGILYAIARRLARDEERELARTFPDYQAYRARVMLPWL